MDPPKKPKSLSKTKENKDDSKRQEKIPSELRSVKSKKESEKKLVTLGICAMKKKVQSKPMR